MDSTRKLMIFLVVPILACAYFGYSAYQTFQDEQSSKDLAQGIERYKREQSGWPQSFANIEPYLENPDALRSMNPKFLPINEKEAYMEGNVWRSLKAERASYRVQISASGACSMLPTPRL